MNIFTEKEGERRVSFVGNHSLASREDCFLCILA